MCGICGMIGSPDQELVKSMSSSLSHRGPDDEGFYQDARAALAMRRLSIIDIEGGHQPVHNEDGSLWVVLNGEIYNYQELKNKLRAKGHEFYTASDTEVIAHLYEEYGDECVHHLNGMFSFAIWQAKEKVLFLARDRLGIKPLYYRKRGNSFIFASELKAILKDRSSSFRINAQALDSYLSFLYIPAPHSIFEGVDKLLPGHTLTLKQDEMQIKNYWKLPSFFTEKTQKKESQGHYIERVRELLKDSVRLRLISERPLGAFLSGGIDSSVVVGLMSALSSHPVKTFSLGYEKVDSAYNELEYARLVSDHFGTEHREFMVKPDIVGLLPKMVYSLDEPFADSSALLTYLISQYTSEHVTVALSGIAGDETFGGYPRYQGALLSAYYQKMPYLLRKGFKGISSFIPELEGGRNVGGWIKRFLKSGLLPADEKYIDWISYFKSDLKDSLYNDEFKRVLGRELASFRHRQYYQDVPSGDYLDRIWSMDIGTYLPDDLLHMGDRMSMAHSLELRVPFCDHRLIELSASIPSSLKMKNFHLKWLLKEAFKDMLPKRVINKRKQGFMVPVGRWIRDDLKEYITDVLSEGEMNKIGYFNYGCIRDILNMHFSGKRVFSHQIWALLIFKIWHARFVENEP